MATILIVEDNQDIADLISLNATALGHTALTAINAHKAFDVLATTTGATHSTVDVIILDWMMPGKSGIQCLKDLKRHKIWHSIPVLMLTCKAEEDDRIEGLEAGAEDYVIKPFSIKELFLRIQKILNHQHQHQHTQHNTSPSTFFAPTSTSSFTTATATANTNSLDVGKHAGSSHLIQAGAYVLDDENKTIYLYVRDLHAQIPSYVQLALMLSPTEFKLLRFLIQHPNHVFSRDAILNEIWQDTGELQDRTVDVHIKRLRQSIDRQSQQAIYAQCIQTVRGFGYRFSIEALNENQ